MEKEILDLIGELAYTCGIMIKELEGKLDYDGSLSWCYKKFTEIWGTSLDMQRNWRLKMINLWWGCLSCGKQADSSKQLMDLFDSDNGEVMFDPKFGVFFSYNSM